MQSSVRVTVAGSGDAFGSGGRLHTCFHVRAREEVLLIDCGATALTGLKLLDLEPNDVTVVVVSHLHGDHFGGLPFLILDGQFRRRTKALHLVGPPGLSARLAQAMESLFPGSTRVIRGFTVDVHEISPGGLYEISGFSIRAYAVEHQSGAPSLALRIGVAGRVITYSGDTTWTDSLIEAADGADLFICEAYTVDRRVPYHLHLPDLRGNLDRLRCERLLLTHAGPQVLAAPPSDLELAVEGMTIDLPASPSARETDVRVTG